MTSLSFFGPLEWMRVFSIIVKMTYGFLYRATSKKKNVSSKYTPSFSA